MDQRSQRRGLIREGGSIERRGFSGWGFVHCFRTCICKPIRQASFLFERKSAVNGIGAARGGLIGEGGSSKRCGFGGRGLIHCFRACICKPVGQAIFFCERKSAVNRIGAARGGLICEGGSSKRRGFGSRGLIRFCRAFVFQPIRQVYTIPYGNIDRAVFGRGFLLEGRGNTNEDIFLFLKGIVFCRSGDRRQREKGLPGFSSVLRAKISLTGASGV